MSETQNKDKIKILSSNQFPVVGVGASAGGLEAFKRLIKAIPEDSGLAFILVQHLEPTHESILTEILQKVTQIPIHEIINNVRVEPNHIYIIPANKLLTATDGVLQLSPRAPGNQRNMPIDIFFTSLAEVHQNHAIGVILSGTATDGTQGLKAIKDHGGITFAQEQLSAAYDAMPQSAIDAGVVDFILTPEEICLQLAELNQTFLNALASDNGDLQLTKEAAFRQLLSLIRIQKGVDFTYYKQTTIRRRILRRMGLNRIEKITDYFLFVEENKTEQELLFQDLLIPVTDFFRDPKTFEIVCETIFPQLMKNREAGNSLRIWIAGCSTGEEPYSMAICLHEYMLASASEITIQIFATDISEKSIAKARSGIYTKREIASLSEERLQKYFTKIDGSFQINKSIRDMCVFAAHNFLKNPPYSKMDLISCRNVLIYFENSLQKKALTSFHYALKPNGFLLLGKSETTGPSADLFADYGKKGKLYTKKVVTGKLAHVFSNQQDKVQENRGNAFIKETGREDFQKSADNTLLSLYTPPGVVVNSQLDIVQFRGSTGPWLEPSSGKPSLNVLKMARPGLAFELRNGLHKARNNNKPRLKENVPYRFMGKEQLVTIEVIPLIQTEEPYFLILFKDSNFTPGLPGQTANATFPAKAIVKVPKNTRTERLENELSQARDDMQHITEDQEAVNEELQSVNEELLSGSEELQSLNEELETSKEEIQSTNEELTTLNQELFDRNEQLNASRIYAESIVATIREPLIILNGNMQVKTANRSYYYKFNTTEEETEDKVFYKLGNGQWDIPALRIMLQNILVDENKITGFEIKQTFNNQGERTMLINASLIFRADITEQLILLAIEDVTEIKKAEEDLKIFTQELEKQVAERTAALKDSNASLKHSNEQLEQFATIASHDLQEPLRKIRTFANLLNIRYNNELAGEGNALLDKISLSAERMSSLIKDVLNFSKILDISYAFEKTDLNVLLNQVISDFDLLIAEKKAVVVHDRLPVINAIPLQINQLFYNMLSNALKFAIPGTCPEIKITLTLLPPESLKKHPSLDETFSYCEIIFQDKGIGFDQQFAEQIFLIFERLNAREHFDGTGIGLALCKRIVINHHGEIYAESNEQEGSLFHIILPIDK